MNRWERFMSDRGSHELPDLASHASNHQAVTYREGTPLHQDFLFHTYPLIYNI
jgi:hypothetical protein